MDLENQEITHCCKPLSRWQFMTAASEFCTQTMKRGSHKAGEGRQFSLSKPHRREERVQSPWLTTMSLHQTRSLQCRQVQVTEGTPDLAGPQFKSGNIKRRRQAGRWLVCKKSREPWALLNSGGVCIYRCVCVCVCVCVYFTFRKFQGRLGGAVG